MTNKNYSVHLNGYNEAAALQRLLDAANSALDEQEKRLTAGDYTLEQFTITVGGVQTAFLLGGPQYTALCEFIQHIADENFYEVDFKEATVSE